MAKAKREVAAEEENELPGEPAVAELPTTSAVTTPDTANELPTVPAAANIPPVAAAPAKLQMPEASLMARVSVTLTIDDLKAGMPAEYVASIDAAAGAMIAWGPAKLRAWAAKAAEDEEAAGPELVAAAAEVSGVDSAKLTNDLQDLWPLIVILAKGLSA